VFKNLSLNANCKQRKREIAKYQTNIMHKRSNKLHTKAEVVECYANLHTVC